MLPAKVRAFVEKNHQAVLTTHRKGGGLQMSIVTVGVYGDGVAFTTTEDRAKYLNLRRDGRCALLVSQGDWWGYVVLEGRARIMAAGNTKSEELRMALREIYRAAAGKEHPDWEEYDQAMRKERRAAVIVAPERIYGTAV